MATPRILIGLDNLKLMIPLKSREGSENGPVVSKTRIGWTIYGRCENLANVEMPVHAIFHNFHICDCTSNNDEILQQMVRNFFSIESLGIVKTESKLDNRDDQRANKILQETTHRDGNKYTTGLLWKYDEIRFPNSLPMAKRRLFHLMKKMQLDPVLAENLNSQIDQYVKKGYARKLTSSETQQRHSRLWYLPIFFVRNPSKPNKTRLVWDAAAKVDGISLNSMLLKGPDMLSSLLAILHRFRERQIGICADIEEMYHRVAIQPADQVAQRFLWPNKDPLQEPDVYTMQVMTFGASCSPCSAQYIKNKNALEFHEQYPRAVTAITKNHYVDDLLDSVDNEEEAITLAKQVKFIHSKGGFNIRNWRSNSDRVVECFGENQLNQKDLSVATESSIEKVLGMWWCQRTDEFTFSLAFNKGNKEVLTGKRRPTKRDLLRTVSSIFDPLGLLANFLIYAKIILQEVWRTGVGWDEFIKDAQQEKWLHWISVLPNVESVRIPRFYGGGKTAQLHVFVDASEDAFGAVAYLRFDENSDVHCSLVGAKTRVAPLKMQSIPRLELEACLIGARFAKTIIDGHSIEISKCYFWSDSRTALAWIKSDHRKYKQYVAFRVSEILDLGEMNQWRWIRSKLNIADEVTKWQKPPDFSPLSKWFCGPEFLRENVSTWPIDGKVLEETSEEIKSYYLQTHSNVTQLVDTERFSKWFRLHRATAFVLRFVHNLNPKNLRRVGEFSREEYQEAENILYKQAQTMHFCNEREILIRNNILPLSEKIPLENSSQLLKLSPFIDEEDVLRVQSRFVAADVPHNMKYPIILPRFHWITFLVVRHHHELYHHQNNETVVNELRQKYYIPQMRVLLKKVRKHCQYCKNMNVVPVPPQMANLPKARVSSFGRSFTYVGIDYFGPLYVSVGRKSEKRWGVLFTCMTTRAIHIEIAYNLTTDTCIMCIENFVNRRGQPQEFYSDNGTNLKGADRELKSALENVNLLEMSKKFTSTATAWHFNPPSSPHMGGSWERLVRSVKTVLREIAPKRNPTDDLLLNMLISVENIVNSRPLTYIPIEDANEEALTPNHFLVGSSNGSKPKGEFTDEGVVWRRNWMKTQQYADHFWRRWIREYLPTLTKRSKWFHPVKPLEKGDVVIIVDDMCPRNCWPKGIVLDVVVGKDGQARKATVQTKTGIYVRPVVKLAVMDVVKRAESSKPIQEISLPGENVGNSGNASVQKEYSMIDEGLGRDKNVKD